LEKLDKLGDSVAGIGGDEAKNFKANKGADIFGDSDLVNS
jgi:hypothetical protein